MNADAKPQSRKSDKTRLVIVTWRDAHADGGSWLSVTDIEDLPYIVESAGFVLDGVKSGHLSICQSLGDDDGVVDHVLHIPMEMIVDIVHVTGRGNSSAEQLTSS